MTREKVIEMLAAGMTQAAIARSLGLTKSAVAYHARRVMEPDPRFRRRYDWKFVQAYYDLGHTSTLGRAQQPRRPQIPTAWPCGAK
jgi:Bacterial regulatory proteins, luxR family